MRGLGGGVSLHNSGHRCLASWRMVEAKAIHNPDGYALAAAVPHTSLLDSPPQGRVGGRVVTEGPVSHVSQSGIHGGQMNTEQHGGLQDSGSKAALVDEVLGYPLAGNEGPDFRQKPYARGARDVGCMGRVLHDSWHVKEPRGVEKINGGAEELIGHLDLGNLLRSPLPRGLGAERTGRGGV